MSVTYSDVSAVCVPFVFAQLCQELTAVEVEKATIVNLYMDISGTPGDPSVAATGFTDGGNKKA